MDRRLEKFAKKKEKLKKIIDIREKVKATSSTPCKGKFSCSKILEKAENLIYSFEFDLALKFCNRALEIEPDNLEALELQGTIHLQLAMFDKAFEIYSRLIDLQPDEGSNKYMCMGQLTCGTQSVQHYLKGAEIMKKEIKEKNPKVTASDLSNAHLSIAEIYLTDECFVDNAADLCKEHLDLALQVDPTNPEVYHIYASYFISLNEKNSAIDMITKGVNLWLPKLKKIDQEGSSELNDNVCPITYSARVNCCKTLIELEMYDLASEILEYLLDEDDQVVEVWYLLGWINHLKGKGYSVNMKVYLEKGLEVAKKLKYENEDMLKHIEELLENVVDDENGDDAHDENDAEMGGDDESEDGDDDDNTKNNNDDQTMDL